MTTRKELFQAILSDPSDELAFLAYADHLEEFGDQNTDMTQAELIRISSALTGDMDDASRSAQETRRGQLQQQLIEERFTPEVATILKAEPDRITFDRGLIQHLDLSGTDVTELPADLKVGGNLYLTRTGVTELPDGLEVGGDLNLSRTDITELPANLKVGRDLDLYGTPIKELPADLKVGRDLNLSVTHITELPADLKVSGNLSLSRTPITELPANLKVVGSLDLFGTPITELPDGLQVGGNLYLSETELTPAAARQIARMEGLSFNAKLTGLASAGFESLAAQVEQVGATTSMTPTRP
jgi:uncharacterized protein (TIGR02996 family)